MSPFQSDPNCPHPDAFLEYAYRRIQGIHGNTSDHRMWCSACRTVVSTVRDAEDYVKQRELKYMTETGNSSVILADMFGTPIEVGSKVVFPTLSGRSATLSFGMVLDINPPTKAWGADTWETWARRPRVDAVDRLKVQPADYTSRWRRYYSSGKAITLSANAPSAVVVNV